MKNLLIITAFIFLCGFTLNAQLQNIRVGPQVTPTFSWMMSNDNHINSNGLNLGTKLGVAVEYYFTPRYALVSGLNWSFNQGGTLLHDMGGNLLPKSNENLEDPMILADLPAGVNIGYHLQYLEIPIALKMRTREFGYMRYYFQIPEFYIGILTKTRGDIVQNDTGLNYTKQLIGDDVTGLNMYLGLGGGIEYSLSAETSLVVGIHYQHSLIDVTKDKGTKSDGTKENSKGSIGILMLKLGVFF